MLKAEELPRPPPLELVKSAVNPFYYALPPPEKSAPASPYQVKMQSSIPCQGCRVRRRPALSAPQVGSVEWDVHPDNTIPVLGAPVEGPAHPNQNHNDGLFASSHPPPGRAMWLKLAPSMYETLQASYRFQEHDPATEGFVLILNEKRELLFTNAGRRCPGDHEMQLLSERAKAVQGLACDHCGDDIPPSTHSTQYECEICDYLLCSLCSSETVKYFKVGDRVMLTENSTGGIGMLSCLGRPDQRLVGVVEGVNQRSVQVRCYDPASPARGMSLYGLSELVAAPASATSSDPPLATSNPFHQPSTSTNLFGQPTNSSNLFGQPSTTPAFGLAATNTNTFGQPSSSTNLFGQPSSSTNLFGQPINSSNLFGQPGTHMFQVGDRVVLAEGSGGMVWCLGLPEQRLVGVVQGPVTSQASLSISCNAPGSPLPGTFVYSHHQLRPAPADTTPAFGQPSTSSTLFGQPSPTTTPAFGKPSNSSTLFGQPSSTSSPFGLPSSTSSPFGQPSSTSSPFGQPSSSSSPFGQPSSTSSPFGQPSSTSSPFGQPSTTAP